MRYQCAIKCNKQLPPTSCCLSLSLTLVLLRVIHQRRHLLAHRSNLAGGAQTEGQHCGILLGLGTDPDDPGERSNDISGGKVALCVRGRQREMLVLLE